MNKQRRSELAAIRADWHKALDSLPIAELDNRIEALKQAEEEAYENLPESLQMSERGEAMSNAISAMDSLIDSLERIQSEIDDMSNYFDSAEEA